MSVFGGEKKNFYPAESGGLRAHGGERSLIWFSVVHGQERVDGVETPEPIYEVFSVT